MLDERGALWMAAKEKQPIATVLETAAAALYDLNKLHFDVTMPCTPVRQGRQPGDSFSQKIQKRSLCHVASFCHLTIFITLLQRICLTLYVRGNPHIL